MFCPKANLSAVVHSVAQIIPAVDGTRNGYRQIAISALTSPVLLSTLISVATTYLHMRGGAPADLALCRQSRALANLRGSLGALMARGTSGLPDDASSLRRDILAAILMQVTVGIANGSNEVRPHITYAFHLFKELGYVRGRPDSAIGLVLVQRMTCLDILSSIFWRRRPFLPVSFWFFDDQSEILDSAPTFQETTGCPQWLISLLARISHLAADHTEGVQHDTLMSQAYEAESDLIFAARTKLRCSTEIPAEHEHLDTVGRCFYWSAIILLQRRVFQDAQDSDRVQSALANLIELMEGLPIGCGPDSSLSLPLYVAAEQAIEAQHRARIRMKSCRLTSKYPAKAREAMTAAFEALWRTSPYESGPASDQIKDGAVFIC